DSSVLKIMSGCEANVPIGFEPIVGGHRHQNGPRGPHPQRFPPGHPDASQRPARSDKRKLLGDHGPTRRQPGVGRPALLAPVGRPLYSRISPDDPSNESETRPTNTNTPMT